MKQGTELFVHLLDEDVDVWRPVEAEELQDKVFRILEQPYALDMGKWEFEPDDLVIGQFVDGADGPFLAAVEKRTPDARG